MTARLHYDRSKLCGTGASEFSTSGNSYPDWEVVFLFYDAVHLVEAYFACKVPPEPPSRDHVERKKKLRQMPELTKSPRFLQAYAALYDISYQVRYDPRFRTTSVHIAKAKTDLGIIVSMLEAKVLRKLTPDPSTVATPAPAAPGADD